MKKLGERHEVVILPGAPNVEHRRAVFIVEMTEYEWDRIHDLLNIPVLTAEEGQIAAWQHTFREEITRLHLPQEPHRVIVSAIMWHPEDFLKGTTARYNFQEWAEVLIEATEKYGNKAHQHVPRPYGLGVKNFAILMQAIYAVRRPGRKSPI